MRYMHGTQNHMMMASGCKEAHAIINTPSVAMTHLYALHSWAEHLSVIFCAFIHNA